MRLYHLSHTDLDGYGCQYISRQIHPDAHFYNSNYGAEISARIKQMANDIMCTEKKGEKILFLITDLNLTTQDCKYVSESVDSLNTFGFDVELRLLDHHLSGEEQAAANTWYTLDNKKCASRLTFEYFGSPASEAVLIDAIDAIDLWKENEPLFECGKVLMRFITETKELNKLLFPVENVIYKHAALSRAKEFLGQKDGHIALDDALHAIKKEYLRANGDNDTLDNLACKTVTTLLSHKKDDFTIIYQGMRGFVTVGIGNVSVIANGFLSANDEYAFFLDISAKGTVSLRSNDKADVCQIAKELFGGGGHKNASGGRISGIRDFFTYQEYKKAVETAMRIG